MVASPRVPNLADPYNHAISGSVSYTAQYLG